MPGGEVRQLGAEVPEGWMGLDIGPGTAAEFSDVIRDARTVLWNGPMGVFEDPRFEAGTRTVAEAVAETRASPWSAAATAPPRWPQFGLDDGRRPPVDGRRRVAGAARAGRPPRPGGAQGGPECLTASR